MSAKKRKRWAIQNGSVNILAGNEPISLQVLSSRLSQTIRPERGVWKITPPIVATALRGHPRIHKFINKQGISMYYSD